MLNKIEISNFQCHYDFTLEFDPLITTIVGRNDSGKTSILRAIEWACLNQPAGDQFISWGKDDVKVILRMDGHEIIRRKGKHGNYYHLDGKEYSSFGTAGVPDEISTIINIGQENLCSQLSLPYWFCASAGEVSRQLNRIVDLEVIDQVLARAASEVRSSRATVEVSERRLEDARAKRKELAWVKEFNADLSSVEKIHNQLTDDVRGRDSLASLLSEAQNIDSRLQNAAESILAAGKAISVGLELANLVKERERLSGLVDEQGRIEEQLCQARATAEQTEAELHRTMAGQICPICHRPIPKIGLLQS